MLKIAILLFLIAALGGVIMAVRIFRDGRPSMVVAFLHGTFAATALLLAIWEAVRPGAAPLLKYGTAALVLAALGGFFLLSFQLRAKAHPKAVVVLHALLAVGGVGLLAISLL